jgi:predicted N-acetyltransferase YhbS
MFTISSETTNDHSAITSLVEQGFGPDRHELTVYRLRTAPPSPDLGFVIRDGDGGPVASLRFWPVTVDDAIPALLLGPLVVAPKHQGAGLGKWLVGHGLDQVTADDWRLCLVVGAPSYYAPHGFEPATPWDLALPGPVDSERFQIRALGDNELHAVLPAGAKVVQPWRWVRRGRLSDVTEPPLAA